MREVSANPSALASQDKGVKSALAAAYRQSQTFTVTLVRQRYKSGICTSHVERANLSIRTGMRRMTRLTNAFSKKWENLKAAYAVWFAFYNFCRIH